MALDRVGTVHSMSAAPFVISVVGPSGVGKTTLIEGLIGILRDDGLAVGTVKHAPHGFDVDRPGSDSWRHRQAGAELTLLAGAGGAVLFIGSPLEPTRSGPHHRPAGPAEVDLVAQLVGRLFGDVDLVLAEGFAPLHDALIEVRRADVPPKQTHQLTQPWMTLTDAPAGSDEYHFTELGKVAARIVERVRSHADAKP